MNSEFRIVEYYLLSYYSNHASHGYTHLRFCFANGSLDYDYSSI